MPGMPWLIPPLCVGTRDRTPCVPSAECRGRGASDGAFPRRAWERVSKILNGAPKVQESHTAATAVVASLLFALVLVGVFIAVRRGADGYSFARILIRNCPSKDAATAYRGNSSDIVRLTGAHGLPDSAKSIWLGTAQSRDVIFYLVFEASRDDLELIIEAKTGLRITDLPQRPGSSAAIVFGSSGQNSLQRGFFEIGNLASARNARFYEDRFGTCIAIDLDRNLICIRE